MKKGVTWNDLHNGSHQELKAKYKLNDRQLENQVQRHLDGASASEKRELYHTVWDKKK
jgi:hypothetical protein